MQIFFTRGENVQKRGPIMLLLVHSVRCSTTASPAFASCCIPGTLRHNRMATPKNEIAETQRPRYSSDACILSASIATSEMRIA